MGYFSPSDPMQVRMEKSDLVPEFLGKFLVPRSPAQHLGWKDKT